MKWTEALAVRLSAVVALTIAVFMSLLVWFASNETENATRNLARSSLEELAGSAEDSVRAYDRELNAEAEKLSAVFARLFPGEFTLDNARQQVVSEQVPTLLSGGEAVAGDYRQVDAFAEATGGNATLFVRRGDDFVRVVTSVQTEAGERAVGTLLDRDSPAYQRNLNGEAFNGKVTLFGRRFITNYTPITDSSGSVIGIRYIGIDYSDSVAGLRDGMGRRSIGDNGYLFIVDAGDGEQRGELVLHPDHQGERLAAVSGYSPADVDAMLSSPSGWHQLSWNGEGALWTVHHRYVPELEWVVAAAMPEAEITAPGRKLITEFAIGIAVTMVLLLGLIVITTRRMVGTPLAEVVSGLEAIAEGDYSQQHSVTHKGEIGQLQRALQQMRSRVREAVKSIAEASYELASSSEQLKVNSRQVAQGSREQNESATSMASTIEELTANIGHLADNADEARRLSEESSQRSSDGAEVVQHADDRMQSVARTVETTAQNLDELQDQSEAVTTIIEVIETIAEQTNLLALNAAIEAARAGDQGRGFAVVAEEVRSLANRTTDSAHEITTMIEQLRAGTGEAVKVMNQSREEVEAVAGLSHQAGEAIGDIRTGADRVKTVFAEISQRLGEQSQANNEVAQSVERIAEMADASNKAVEEVAEASSELEAMARQLREVVGQFRL